MAEWVAELPGAKRRISWTGILEAVNTNGHRLLCAEVLLHFTPLRGGETTLNCGISEAKPWGCDTWELDPACDHCPLSQAG